MVNVLRSSHDRAAGNRETNAVWLVAAGILLVGGISALLAFWRGAHLIESVLGLATLPAGAIAQMFSTETNQRWLIIVGVVAGGFGLGLGVAHGGFVA